MFNWLINRIADRVIDKMKQDRPSSIGFHSDGYAEGSDMDSDGIDFESTPEEGR